MAKDQTMREAKRAARTKKADEAQASEQGTFDRALDYFKESKGIASGDEAVKELLRKMAPTSIRKPAPKRKPSGS